MQKYYVHIMAQEHVEIKANNPQSAERKARVAYTRGEIKLGAPVFTSDDCFLIQENTMQTANPAKPDYDDNLTRRIQNAHNDGLPYLSEREQASLLLFAGHGCRENTRKTLKRRIALPLVFWSDYGIYRRLSFVDGQVEYTAGQDYTAERATIRKCLLSL